MAKSSASRWRRALASALLPMTALAPNSGSAAPGSDAAANAAPLDLRAAAGTVNIALLRGPDSVAGTEELYLEVYLNSVRTGRVLQVSATADGRLLAWADNLLACGLQVDDAQLGRYVELGELDGLRHRYDALNQRLYFDADAQRLRVQTQHLGSGEAPVWEASVSPGALLNYDLYASAGEQRSLAAGTALRLFGDYGYIESSGLSRYAEGRDAKPYTRLDTAWTYSQQSELLSITVGDHIAGSLPWTRATRMGGIQWRRNFALQPGLLTYPVPQFFGEAALPSQVELYVNGVRQYEGRTSPGPFQISAPPSVNGAAQAQVVLTDTLGRSQTLDFSFYSATRLLRQGYSDFSLGVGAVRRHYGIDSFDYGDEPAANASYALGLSDWLTLESHAEADRRVQMGGAGGVVRIGEYGEARGAYALSRSRDQRQAQTAERYSGSGGQFAVGYNYSARGYTAGYSLQRADRGFRDLAAAEGRAPNRRSEQALLGSALGRHANVSLSYVRLDSADGESFRNVGLNASAMLWRRASAYFSVARDLDDGDVSLFVGLSATLGTRLNAGVGAGDTRGARTYDAYLSAPIPADGGSGWQLRAHRAQGSEFLQGDFGQRGDYGDWSAGLQSFDDRVNGFASASGSIVMMDAALFASRQVDDGFALVTTNGIAQVPVLFENRLIGETDARGHYLLTGLNAYQPNRIAIDPLNLPAQVQAGADVATVVPAQRAGVRVAFGLHESRAALLILHDENDQPLPVGSTVVRDDRAPAIVGFDGQTYLEDLALRNRITVERADGVECTAQVDYPPSAQGIPVLGPLRCAP